MQGSTIAAIATPPGAGGIAVVRLSGAESYPVAARVFHPANAAKKVEEAKGYTALFGHFVDREEAFDEGVALFFREPHSYTGEDSAEFHCHGSPVVLHTLLSALFAAGARQAGPGEFTKRAFLNGRLDLTEAEAVVDLIESETAAAARNAAAQLSGSLRRDFQAVTDSLLDIATRFYAVVDYPDEDIPDIHPEEVDRSLIQRCRLFHFGSLSLTDEPARSATRAAVAYARELGRTVTFDPNLRLPLWPSPAEARAQILWSLCQADVVKLSDEEVDFLWGCSPQEGARRLLEECGVSLAMVTLGPRGCYLQNRRGSCALTAPQVSPVDTTGAGDIFGGSALHRLLDFRVPPEELDRGGLEEIARFAVTAASLSTQHPGGIPSIPELAQVVARMGEPAPLSL